MSKYNRMSWCGAIFTMLVVVLNAQNMQPLSEIEEQEAYESLERAMSPLSEGQIKSVRELFNRINRASSYKEAVPPAPTFSSVVVDLQPGGAPPAIRLASGYVSSLVFVDSTGAPWPIKAYDVGDPTSFNIVWNQDGSADPSSMSNTLLIQALSLYKDGNLAVVLQGMNTPIMLSLISGQGEVDYRVDISVPGRGPNARVGASDFTQASNPLLNQIVNNISPSNSKMLKVHGGKAKAWLFGDTMYVRTSLSVVSPAWISTMRGAGDTIQAYELPISPVILVMENGRLRKLTVEGF